MPSAPLFDISVTHDYYANLRCEDFAIVPAATTEAAMARLRLTYKSLSDRIRIYAELNAGGDALAAGAAPLSLDFALRPRSSSYAAITKLRDLAEQPAPLFTNDGVAATNPLPLRLTSRRARTSETLIVSAPASTEPFVLAGTPLNGATAADFTVTGAGPVKSVAASSKRITVDTSAMAPNTAFQVSYPVRAATSRGAIADIALILDAPLLKPMPTPRAFVVPFTSADSRWAYYVVTDFSGDLSTLTVVDAAPGGAPRAINVADAGRLELTAANVTGDAVGTDLLGRYPTRVMRLLSDAPVATRDTPLGSLELRLTNAALISHLPNPPPDRLVLLQVEAPPSPRQMVRYQVVMLLTN